MKREWTQVEVNKRAFIPFLWKDPTPGGQNLGRAEFVVCIKFKGKRISEFWVYPKQTRIDTCWHFNDGDIDFTISAYEDLEREGAWLVSKCQEHKCTSLSVYSPPGAKYLEINNHGLSFWRTAVYKEGVDL